MIVEIERINSFEFCFAQSDDAGKRLVAQALTFDNPDPFAYSDKIEMFSRTKFTFRIGMIGNVKAFAERRNVPINIHDYQYQMPDVAVDDRMSGRYVHQRQAVEAFFRRRFGIIVVPTRGGKTFIASEILRIFMQTDEGNFLFVTDNTTLFTQARDDIRKFFERYGGVEVGEICSGKINVKRVTVAMIQTIQTALSKRSAPKRRSAMAKYLKSLAFLCVDEIHDNCSDARLRVYKRCSGLRYQLCLSATPYRANAFHQNLKLQAWSGDVIFTISDSILRERHVLSDYRVAILYRKPSKLELRSVDENDYADCCRGVIYENEERNKILEDVIQVCRNDGYKTLVLFQSIEHGKLIARRTGLTFISGVTSAEEREVVKRAFLNEQGGVLLASNIFKKGVTLPEVEVLINADGGLEDANTIQRKGRVLGATETKQRSMVIDFFDDAPYFDVHSVSRVNAYADDVMERALSYYDTASANWKQEIKETMRKWLRRDEE